MEASLLVSPKHSMPRAVSLIFSAARGPAARRCLVAAATTAGSHSKERGSSDGGEVQQVAVSAAAAAGNKAMVGISGGRLFAAATMAATVLPCTAAELEVEAGDPSPPALGALYRAVAVLGDLDPATAKTVAGVAGPALSAFGFLFILRIVMSWYPRLPVTEFPYVLAYAPTEPFLAVTRKLIPPLGGVDVTPVVWFGLVSFLNEILVGPQGLLVLLSQQQA